MDEHDWEKAVKLRGRSFQRNLQTYRLLAKLEPKNKETPPNAPSFNVAVVNIGAPAGGELNLQIQDKHESYVFEILILSSLIY